MGSSTASAVALMSIHPEYAEALLSGSKKVEFRRLAPKEEVGYVVVYATKPVGAILGVLQIDSVERDSPERLWARYRDVGGISFDGFFQYFDGCAQGSALVVKQAWRCKAPMDLHGLGLAGKAPQSFKYLDPSTFRAIASGATRTRAEPPPSRIHSPAR